MRISALAISIILFPFFSIAQRPFVPIQVTGFNEDVIAEGTGKNALGTTSKEMDALVPSNFVLCSREFAQAIAMPRNSGLPNDGRLFAQNKTFLFAPYGNPRKGSPNTLYLMRGEKEILRLSQMVKYEKISILGLATEGSATVNINLYFIDGTSRLIRNQFFPDWFDGSNAIFSGFGRVKREDGVSSPIYFEGPPTNPNLYTIDLALPQDKILAAIEFQNVSAGNNPASNRAFIFALSGMTSIEPVVTPVETTTPVEPKEVKSAVTPAIIPVTPLVSNSFFLHGKVIDGKTKSPLNAKISLAEIPASTTSESSGDYKMNLSAAGDYTIKVEATGYISILQKTKIISSPSGTELNLTLQPVEIGTTVNLKSVLFQVSTANLLEESYDELNLVVDMLKGNPKMSIDLAGHTDSRGDKKLNLKLSTDRVNVVKKYIVDKGIAGDRISGTGYGGSRPLSKGKTEADYKLNRRVEFVVTKY